ncbi:MAG: glycosyltransferase [Nitrospiraceae bacterium]|nr:MAG: glycosyltransferase [Nitrospiraceae bacterium]
MEISISVVIPNYNKADTIGKCLEAVFSSRYGNFEVVVVDDKSEDGSVEVVEKFPCKLIRLESHAGTSRARNIGAQKSSGEIIFFTDADCLFQKDTLSIINRVFSPLLKSGKDVVIGGTYTRMPYDKNFFSIFQSVFINYSETKYEKPDYIAAHAMIIKRGTFNKSKGFPEVFLPIIEDVEFSHRLRKTGCELVMAPGIQVQHIFNFSFSRSVRNAFRKSKYWNMYSLKNRDLTADSGTASTELKTNVASFFLCLTSLVLWLFMKEPALLYLPPSLLALNAFVSRRLLKAFNETGGVLFAMPAFMYYSIIYPVPVGLGAVAGMIEYFKGQKQLLRSL